MLNTISRIYANKNNKYKPGLDSDNRNRPQVFQDIEKHLTMLHYRNSQLRNAIMAKSEETVRRRHGQFVTVLRSYVRLIIVELHEPISNSMQIDAQSKYLEIREETYSGYEQLIARSNRTTKEMLRLGTEFARDLFQLEIQLKQLQNTVEKCVYPIYYAVHQNS